MSGTTNRYAEPAFRQNGVACERCHGPGSEHVQGCPHGAPLEPRCGAARRCLPAVSPDGRSPRSARGPDLRTVSRGRPALRLRCLLRLRQSGWYTIAHDEPLRKISESRCKQVSGEKIWCGTCHDIHNRPADSVGWYRSRTGVPRRQRGVRGRRTASAVTCPSWQPWMRDMVRSRMTRSRADQRARERDRRLGGFAHSALPIRGRELDIAYLQLFSLSGDVRQRNEGSRLAIGID